VLAVQSSADHLAITKDGDGVLAGSSVERTVLKIDLANENATHLYTAREITSLMPLRDGRTFLLSISPNLSLLKLAPGPEIGPAIVVRR
jgi:hypothetical protein